MNRCVVLLLCVQPFCMQAANPPNSVGSLNVALEAGPNRKIGFLSEGNYHSVAHILPEHVDNGGLLQTVYHEHLDDLEAAVESGELLAAMSTSRPDNINGTLLMFNAGLVSVRAAFFRKTDCTETPNNETSDHLRQAMDASVIRMIKKGGYQRISEAYFQSNKFESLPAFSCAVDDLAMPFPAAADATGLLRRVLDDKELKIAALGTASGEGSNWGYQGTYNEANPTGLWPEILSAITDELILEYGDISVIRQFYTSSQTTMEAVNDGLADMSEPYWTVPGTFADGSVDRARTELFEVGCTVLGTDQIFFTHNPASTVSQTQLETIREAEKRIEVLTTAAIVIIVLSAVVVLGLCACVTCMIRRERRGEPMFEPIIQNPTDASSNDAVTTPI